jgi:metal iron transporter
MAMLYIIYAMAEIAIIATDLAELLGSAIALNLYVPPSTGMTRDDPPRQLSHTSHRLFPKLPLYAGVLITAVDVLFVLVFFQRPEAGRRGMMAFEGLIVGLVLCVFVCFIILLVQIKPDWSDVFEGYLPSKVSGRKMPLATR